MGMTHHMGGFFGANFELTLLGLAIYAEYLEPVGGGVGEVIGRGVGKRVRL